MAELFPTDAPDLTYGVNLTKEFRVLRSDFGDGYSQRTPDGLNIEIEKWSLIWNNITLAQKDIIINFLDARQGAEAILFTMPGEDTAKKWICASYKYTPFSSAYYRIDATFERVYDL